MQARLPLKITITSCDPTRPDGPVECAYDVHDADDNLVTSSHFTTAPENVDEVSRYTLDRLSQSFVTAPAAPTMSPEARASLDQVLSPVGIAKGKKVAK